MPRPPSIWWACPALTLLWWPLPGRHIRAAAHLGTSAGDESSFSSPTLHWGLLQAKKSKPTPAHAAATLDHAQVVELTAHAQRQYAGQPRMQLEALANFLVSSFQDTQLAFNKMLAEQPLEKVSLS